MRGTSTGRKSPASLGLSWSTTTYSFNMSDFPTIPTCNIFETTLWGSVVHTTTSVTWFHIVKLQKKIIRIIAISRYNAHTEPIFKMLKLLKLRDIFNANIIKFYYKLKHGCLPSYFNSFRLTSQDQIHTYGTRHNYTTLPRKVGRKR